ncbi:hypothetical protein QFC21_000716 [Naganishia friedmannii]|uniref:Uncharacterized protein n=1 Tax=Naganishia friedmannii TaxID=89922 RepID=A0ACC2W7T7_9TREE|nr:hypothetical protein QFC21_000716 [Naganishia friedmannii]
MAFLFSKHRRQSSVDRQDRPTTFGNRKPSVDLLTGDHPRDSTFPDAATSPSSGTSKINALKQKLTSRSILNLNAKHEDPSLPQSPSKRRLSLSGFNNSSVGLSPTSPSASAGRAGRRSSLATSAIPQAPASSDRLADITGSPNVYPPGTTFFSDTETPLDENSIRQGSSLQPATAANGTRAALNDSWKPIEPERRALAPSSTSTSAVNGESRLTGTFVSPAPTFSSSSPRASSTRPEVGKISIPPPTFPSRLASSSHFRDSPLSSPVGGWSARTPVPGSARTPGGNGWGRTIIPSTPLPQPIANLPTFRDNHAAETPSGSGPGSRSNQTREGPGGGYGFPMIPAGGAEGRRSMGSRGGSRSGSAATSPTRGTENTPAEIRRAKKHMPVMLREPSHQPPPQSSETQEDSEDDEDDDESSSEEGDHSGASSSEAETETEEGSENRASSSGPSRSDIMDDRTGQPSTTTSSGTAAARSQVQNRPRQASGPHYGHGRQLSVSSIREENEDDSNTFPNFATYQMSTSPTQHTSVSDVSRMIPSDSTGSQQSALSSRRHVDQPRLSLTSLDAAAPGPSKSATWDLGTPKTPTAGAQAFFNPSWTSFNAATPTGGPPPNPVNSVTASSSSEVEYPRSAVPHKDVPVATPRDESPRNVSTGEYFTASASESTDGGHGIANSSLAGENVTTPIQRASPALPQVADIAPPLAALNLGAPVAASSTPTGTSPSTPLIVNNPDGQPQFAVLKHATAEDESVLLNTIPGPPDTPTDSGMNSRSLTPAMASPAPSGRFARPSFYKQASRSMVDVASPSREEDGESQQQLPSSTGMDRTFTNASTASNAAVSAKPPSGVRTPVSARSSVDWAKPPPTPGIGMMQPFKFPGTGEVQQSPKQMVQNRQLQALGPSPMKRRRSLDDIHVRLPDYAPPAKGIWLPRPREEEGHEKLPEYFCHVHIEGYLPRKMEFTAPGVQARDRSWKRHYFVIHGTALSVYKHDIHKVPLKSNDPHPVPEIDEADYDNLHVHRPGELRRGSLASTAAAALAERRSSPAPSGSPSNGSRRGSVVDTGAVPNTREGLVAAAAARRASMSAGTSISTSASNGPDSKDLALFTSSSNASTSSGGRRPSVSSSQLSHPTPAGGHAREIAVHLPFHGGNSLIKQYTLQHAESGLAADYVKKKNVVRVRVEGEQFLLQTESAKDVVDWIEALQAASNVALDLDERPMPKIITLPRRRRRRRPGEPAPPVSAPGVPDTEDTPEGNARAVAEAERAARAAEAARDRNLDAMDRMLAEDQAA